MGNIPLPALDIKPPAAPPNPLQQYAQMMGLRNEMQMQPLRVEQAQQAVQGQQMQNEMNQRMMDSQTALMNAWAQSGGDMNQAMTLAQKSGKVLPQDLMGFQQKSLGIQQAAANLIAAKGKQAQSDADAWAGAAKTVADAPADQKASVYQQQLQSLSQGGHNVSKLPPTYPGDQAFQSLNLGVMGLSQAVKNQLAQSKIESDKAEHGVLSPEQIQGLNGGLAQRYAVLNPTKPVPANLQLGANATADDFNRIDKLMEGTERGQQTAQQQTANLALRQQTLGMMNQFRQAQLAQSNDRLLAQGYQYANNFIDKKMQPLQQLSQRAQRLDATLQQANPQSDALVAPEVLSIMAGGQGSGLRMNEAEINRLVGGATNWTHLQQSLNKWSTDPAHAQIPPAQRAQLQKLVNYVQDTARQQLNLGMDAQQQLLSGKSPEDYHRTLNEFSQKFGNAVQSPTQAPASGNAPFGWRPN